MAKNKGFFKEIWIPDYLIPHNREDKVRITLRKLLFYCVFLILFSAGKLSLLLSMYLD